MYGRVKFVFIHIVLLFKQGNKLHAILSDSCKIVDVFVDATIDPDRTYRLVVGNPTLTAAPAEQ